MKLQVANERLRALEERSKLASELFDLTKETASVADRDLVTAKHGLSDARVSQKEVEERMGVIHIAESDEEDENDTPASNTPIDDGVDIDDKPPTAKSTTSASAVLDTAESESGATLATASKELIGQKDKEKRELEDDQAKLLKRLKQKEKEGKLGNPQAFQRQLTRYV